MRILTLGLLALALSACNSLTGVSNIEYRVSGAARASITYQNSSGSTSQIADRTLPWSYSLTAQRGDFLYVSAQNSGSTGCVRAEIYKGSVLFESGFSCGAFVIATASGTN
jgi:hypothetical protein